VGIDYERDSVTITFRVTALSGQGDCPMAPGAPYTVRLDGPLGDRLLVDGDDLAGVVVIEHSADFLALATHRVEEYAAERFEARFGAEGCTVTSTTDRYAPTDAEVLAAVEALGGGDGHITGRGYVSEDWLSAARAFGAVEAYVGRPKPWYILTSHEGSAALRSMSAATVAGRTVWWPSDDARLPNVDCEQPQPTPSPTPASELPIRHECTRLPSPPEVTPAPRPLNAVWDETGLVELCSETDWIPELVGDISMSNQDARQVAVVWALPGCREFTFRRAGDRFELIGGISDEPCFGSPIFLRFFQPMSAELIDARIEGGAQVPALPAPTELECPYADRPDRRTEVSITDFSGLVVGCEAFLDLADPDSAVRISETDTETVIAIAWEREGECRPLPAGLTFWKRIDVATAPPSAGVGALYQLHVEAKPGSVLSYGCTTAPDTQGVRLRLAEPIKYTDLDAFLTRNGAGEDRITTDVGTFALSVTADKSVYAAGEPIAVSALLTYRGPDESFAVAGGPNIFDGRFQQLDGDLRSPPFGMILPCIGHGVLRAGEPRDFTYRLPTEWPSQHPYADFFELYTQDGLPTLPIGLYRFEVSASFSGSGCQGGQIELAASVVIEVR
jgi:hypothetical protein